MSQIHAPDWASEIAGEIISPGFIRWVQSTLNSLMSAGLDVDGILGPRTRAAVQAFQRKSGLVQDGIPGPLTEGALSAANATLRAAPVSAGVGPCSLVGRPEVLDRFEFAKHALRPFHQEQIIRLARCILSTKAASRRTSPILVVGHTDPVGTDRDNFMLGQARAEEVRRQLVSTIERISPGASAGLTLKVESRGETQQIPGSPERSRRVEVFVLPAPVPTPTVRKVMDVRVVVKSFIAPIGSRVGTAPCFLPLPAPPPAPLIITADQRLAGLALATDAAFSENPLADRKDKAYRLYSERTFTATCEDGKLINVTPRPLVDTDAGLECIPATGACLQPPPLIPSSITVGPVGPGVFGFSWTVKGKPHPAAEPAFQLVCPRTSVFIWHTIAGEIECSGPIVVVRTRLHGSAFPSHRVFVNGSARLSIPQGPFSNLWVPDLFDPTKVR